MGPGPGGVRVPSESTLSKNVDLGNCLDRLVSTDISCPSNVACFSLILDLCLLCSARAFPTTAAYHQKQTAHNNTAETGRWRSIRKDESELSDVYVELHVLCTRYHASLVKKIR